MWNKDRHRHRVGKARSPARDRTRAPGLPARSERVFVITPPVRARRSLKTPARARPNNELGAERGVGLGRPQSSRSDTTTPTGGGWSSNIIGAIDGVPARGIHRGGTREGLGRRPGPAGRTGGAGKPKKLNARAAATAPHVRSHRPGERPRRQAHRGRGFRRGRRRATAQTLRPTLNKEG